MAAPPIFVVADGVGGSHAGEVASSVVTEEFSRLRDLDSISSDHVTAALHRAHERVLGLNENSPNFAATTAAGAVGVDMGPGMSYWLVFNIGDSRVYRCSAGPNRPLSQVSVDHSYVQELLDAGALTPEQAWSHPDKNVVTRAVGAEAEFDPDFWLMPMVPGERLIVCSDGLLNDSPGQLVKDIIKGVTDPHRATDELLELALRCGARDNVSVIVVDVVGDDLDSTVPMAQTVLTARNGT